MLAPPTDQDQGVCGQFDRISSGSLSSAQSLVNKGKWLAKESLQRKRKRALSSENNESEVQGEGLMADARQTSHVGEFYNINSDVDLRGELLTSRSTNCFPISLRLSLHWLNECLSRDE